MSKDNLEPWHLSATDCARWLGIARSTFSERGYAPALELKKRKYFDVRELIAEKAVAGIVSENGETVDHDFHNARLTKAKADIAEVKALREHGQIAPIELFTVAFQDFAGLICQSLEGLPGGVRRADPEISVRAIETIENQIAEFRNLAADKCTSLAQDVCNEADLPGGAGGCEPDTQDEAA